MGSLVEVFMRKCVGFASGVGLVLLVSVSVPGSLGAQIPNDLCSGAITLDCSQGPFALLGNNSGATGTNAPYCGTTPGDQAVWYKVMGNGFDIQVDTCSPSTVFDTKINVYTGSCADEPGLTCIGGNDDAAGTPPECALGGTNRLSRVIWTSIVDVEYLIVVSGFSGAAGDFEILLDCEVPVELQRFSIE